MSNPEIGRSPEGVVPEILTIKATREGIPYKIIVEISQKDGTTVVAAKATSERIQPGVSLGEKDTIGFYSAVSTNPDKFLARQEVIDAIREKTTDGGFLLE